MTALPELPTAEDQQVFNDHIDQLRSQQNLPLAVGLGLIAAVVGGFAWAAVTVLTEYQIGFMAIGVGFLVGFAMRFGKGIEPIFGYVGGALALVGCLLGNLFALIGFIADYEELSIGETLAVLNYSYLPEGMLEMASPIDLLFYALAAWAGHKYAFRSIDVA